MSTAKRVIIFCDRSGCRRELDGVIGACTARVRVGLRKDGWRRRAGKDYCPHCARAGHGLNGRKP